MNTENNLLEKDIPENVSLRDLRFAVDAYKEAHDIYMELGKMRCMVAVMIAGDNLYRLVRGLLKRGALYTYRDAVVDSAEGDEIPKPEDFI